tara:strand:- start:7278 stop:7658 length:381 start_codon:yes stop_codon:yes gene_type:complete
MVTARFTYPGEGPNSRAFSGALTPQVTRITGMKSSVTRGNADGPLFGARGQHLRRAAFELSWPTLTHAEAQSLMTQWDESNGGTRPMTYTPDDQTLPMTVLSTGAPQITYTNSMVASVTLNVQEQR